MSDSTPLEGSIDCPPQRETFKIDGKLDAQAYFKAIQKCNEEKAKRNATKRAEKPEGCNNELIQDKDDDGDILVKFILENGTNHCMYVSEFKKYIQNICNLYTEWTCMDESRCKDSDSGTGYTPIMQALDLSGILKFTNHCCVIEPLFWQVPIFSKGFLTMKTILEIQQKIEAAGTKSESEIEIKIKEDKKSGDTFRTGNIYGTFGIGQSHAQKEDTLFYVLSESSDSLEDCSIKPDKDIFNFAGMETKLSLQLEIKDAVNYLYQNPMDLTKEPWNEFFLTDKKFKEEDLCPDTETVIDVFFSYYNNEILKVAAEEYNNEQSKLDLGAIKSIEISMTLEEMRKIITDNHLTLQKSIDDYDKNQPLNDEAADLRATMNPDSPSPRSRSPSLDPQSPTTGPLFSGSHVSPFFSRTPLSESRRSSEYDFVLSPERVGIERSPISPIMRSLHMSELETSRGRNLFSDFDDEPDTPGPATPGPGGGKSTFNRKKKPKKNKTKKRKRTKKYNKKICRKISIKK